MSQDGHISLAPISVEWEIATEIIFDDIIDQFTNQAAKHAVIEQSLVLYLFLS